MPGEASGASNMPEPTIIEFTDEAVTAASTNSCCFGLPTLWKNCSDAYQDNRIKCIASFSPSAIVTVIGAVSTVVFRLGDIIPDKQENLATVIIWSTVFGVMLINVSVVWTCVCCKVAQKGCFRNDMASTQSGASQQAPTASGTVDEKIICETLTETLAKVDSLIMLDTGLAVTLTSKGIINDREKAKIMKTELDRYEKVEKLFDILKTHPTQFSKFLLILKDFYLDAYNIINGVYMQKYCPVSN